MNFAVGYFYLNNTRSLDDDFLTEELTSAAVGIINPALTFDDSPGTKLTRTFYRQIQSGGIVSFGGRTILSIDRKQKTLELSDNLNYVSGNHTFQIRRRNIV
jgi:hypothetical protein